MRAPLSPLTAPIHPGPLVLEASAGTGKTFAIIQLTLRILLGTTDVHSRGPRHLLLITFTRAATAELQERLRNAIRAAEAIHHGRRPAAPHEEWIETLLAGVPHQRTTALLTRLDDLAVTTIHGFCVGVLSEFPAECGVRDDLTLLDDDAILVTELLDDVLRASTWRDPWTAALVATSAWSGETFHAEVAAQRIAPSDPPSPAELDARLQECQAAVGAITPQWDRRRFTALLDQVHWREKAALAHPAVRQEHVEAIDRLVTGDPIGLVGLLPFDAATLPGAMRKRSREEKAARDALVNDPVVAALYAAVDARHAWQAARQAVIVAEVLTRLPARKMREGLITYDDQIRLVSDALQGAESGPRLAELLHQRYDAVLVDEAQDTNPDQWRVIDTIFARRPRIIVGDPKQAIYGWRGADLQAYLDARAGAGPERTLRLDRNWRSTPALLAALEQLFTRAPDPFGVPATEMNFVPVSAAAQRPPLVDPGSDAALRWVIDTEGGSVGAQRSRICRSIVNEIRRLLAEATLGDRGLRPGDIAILVQKHREATRYRDALRDVGIHAVTAGTGDVATSRSWQELEILVRALAAPRQEGRRRAAAATTLIGVSAAELVAWAVDPALPAALVWQEQLVELAEQATWAGVFVALTHLLGRRDAVSRLAALPRGERHLTDLRHTLALIQEAESGLGRTPWRVADWMRRLTSEAMTRSGQHEHRQLRLESDADAVQIRTIHVAKGLEYPVVFVPSGWEDSARGGRRDLPEAMRLFYVAVTRAEARCCLALGVNGGTSVFDRGPLGHLLRPLNDQDAGVTLDVAAVRLIAASDGAMDQVVPGTIPPLPVPDRPVLVARRDPPRPLPTWGITSYTRLITGEILSGGATPSDIADPGESVPVHAADHPLDLLPVGARSGLAVHALFERIPFDADDDTIETMVRQTLTQAGIGATFSLAKQRALYAAVRQMTADTLRTPMPRTGFALAEVPTTATLREWTFHLRITRDDLPAMVERFQARGGEFAAYAASLAPLTARGIDGYLTGTIDLACQHQGRWYLVDWKSNRLGGDPSAYAPTALRTAMTTHHYYLQQELYRMALDRYLGQRVPAWDTATMFGGVGYAFVRGNAWWEAR